MIGINNWLRSKLNYKSLKNICIGMPVCITLIIVSFMACESEPNEQTLWVNSAKVDCVGVGPMQCFQIKNEENEPWSNFYQEISGFDYEPGFIYKLKVSIDTLDKATLPADKSYLEYTLIDVLSKEKDPYLSLHDIWAITEIVGVESKLKGLESRPNLEINIRTMSIMGSDGCNQYRGKIETLSGNEIRFGPIMGTKKACPEMHIPNKYTSALSKVSYFKREGLQLIFYDKDTSKLLTFKKVD
jgi:heat shock protein HslJ